MDLTGAAVHQGCRIHASRLESGVWVASVVAPGGTVKHIRGEFHSQDAAINAARRDIDDCQEGQRTE